MKKLNTKGFTLIELLAVIVIMGILMMIAIPAMTRYIENSRKDTFLSTAKEYTNAVRNMWASDSLSCGGVSSSAVPAGTYYVEIDSLSNKNNLLESGGKSSWANAEVKGYVKVVVSASDAKNTLVKYYVALADSSGHGIKDNTTEADRLKRGNVETSGVSAPIPDSAAICVEG